MNRLNNLIIWNVKLDKEFELKINGNRQVFNSIAWSPDGKQVAFDTDDNILRIVLLEDLFALKEVKLKKIKAYNQSKILYTACANIKTVDCSPNGEYIAFPDNHVIKIWDLEKNQEIKALNGHTDTISAIKWSQNGHIVISTAYDNKILGWNLTKNESLNIPLLDSNTTPSCIAQSFDSNQLAVGFFSNNIYKPNIVIIGNPDMEKKSKAIINTKAITSIAWSKDDIKVAYGSSCGQIKIYDTQTNKSILLKPPHDGVVTSLVWYKNYLISGSSDKTIRFFNLDNNNVVFFGSKSIVTSLALSPDEQILAIGTHDKEIILFDINTHKALNILDGHADAITSLVWTCKGQLISASKDKTIRIWGMPYSSYYAEASNDK